MLQENITSYHRYDNTSFTTLQALVVLDYELTQDKRTRADVKEAVAESD